MVKCCRFFPHFFFSFCPVWSEFLKVFQACKLVTGRTGLDGEASVTNSAVGIEFFLWTLIWLAFCKDRHQNWGHRRPRYPNALLEDSWGGRNVNGVETRLREWGGVCGKRETACREISIGAKVRGVTEHQREQGDDALSTEETEDTHARLSLSGINEHICSAFDLFPLA